MTDSNLVTCLDDTLIIKNKLYALSSANYYSTSVIEAVDTIQSLTQDSLRLDK